ncbi:MAG: NTP transferase domain-containing protein [Verrucomicrobiae bacterium]|jgi:choline kinase|nr:NTP transferase domain-containing protein [Verrucomicrobiae bacterium]
MTNFSEHTAVVLLAGYGSRLSGLTRDPKSLLKVGDRSILKRHLAAFRRLGFRRVVLVVGYRKDLVIAEAGAAADALEIHVVANDDYERKGNGCSLLMGLEAAKGAVVVFDGDLVYSPSILERFMAGSARNAVLIGPAAMDDVECTKALTDETNHVRKMVDKRLISDEELIAHRFAGEAIGVMKFDDAHRLHLIELLRDYYSEENRLLHNWEHPLNRFIARHDVAGHHEASEDWIEIDTPEDFEAACAKADRLDS